MKMLGSLLLAATLAIAADNAKPEDFRNVPVVDVEKIEKSGDKYHDRVVKLQFTLRSATVERDTDGKLVGEVGRYGGIPLTLPKDAEPWFMKLPTETSYDRKAQTFSLFVRLRYAAANEFSSKAWRGEALGRELKITASGQQFVW